MWKIFIFEWISLLEIQTNCKNWVWKGKFRLDLNVFTLPNLEIFNSENAKNKGCVHTWANSTSYTSKFLFKLDYTLYQYEKNEGYLFHCQSNTPSYQIT